MRRHRGTARRFSEDQNVGWIAPERRYVLLHPSESLALILYAPIPRAAWLIAGGCDPRSGLEAVRCQVAEDSKPEGHRDDDDVAPRLLNNCGAVVAVGGTADKAAAVQPHPDGKRSSRLNHFRIRKEALTSRAGLLPGGRAAWGAARGRSRRGSPPCRTRRASPHAGTRRAASSRP